MGFKSVSYFLTGRVSPLMKFLRQNCSVRNCSHTSSLQNKHHNVPEDLVLVEHYNAITLIGLNRPSKRNALCASMIATLRKELKTFESNESSSVAVLYGTGGNFCSGLDLHEVADNKPSIPLIDEYCSKPVIAALSGYAVGEGFDLALACDVRIMDDKAILGSFNRRFGVPMSQSSICRVSASFGFAIAMDLILSGRPVNADEAFRRGVVQCVVPCGASKGNAITYAQSLTKYPQAALRADRAALYNTLSLSEDSNKSVESEIESNSKMALEEMRSQAKRFFEGVGKHGKFKGLTEQSGRPDWMK